MYSSSAQSQQQTYYDLPQGSQPTSSADIYAQFYGAPFPPIRAPDDTNAAGSGGFYQQTSKILAGGTILHKGFYDLLSLIPTPASASRFWASLTPDPIAGPRYEDQAMKPAPNPPALTTDSSRPAQPLPGKPTGRRITKNMVSKPTGFVHLVHASDAEQAEAILRRWGPDGLGKLGDPRWATPIKNLVRENAQARAINQVVTALNTGQSGRPLLRVVNGISTPTASVVTTVTATATLSKVGAASSAIEGLPAAIASSAGKQTSTKVPLRAHAEHEADDIQAQQSPRPKPLPEVPRKPEPTIVPSLPTLEKAVAARIYFENLYFAILRKPPSREQRRRALEKELGAMRLSDEAKQEIRERWLQNETDYLRDRRAKVGPSAFVKLKTIGHGAFGVVSLVRERKSGQLFAMKQLRKTDMLRRGQEGHVRAERDVLTGAAAAASSGSHQWIVKLFYSFQDRDHLYLVLEYMPGGDLLNLLIEKDVFGEDFTRFYIAEMILAVEQCHKQGFIHRDIKPDNFLFAPDGHIKLSDFGLATDLHWAHDTSYYEQQRKDLLRKHGIDLADGGTTKNKRMDRKTVQEIMGGEEPGGVFTWRDKNRKKLAYSVCGTNSYMSPEVIRGQGYSMTCDWWSVGVIMFECLYGYPPFVSNSRHVTRQKILNWRHSLKFPPKPRVSFDGISLMRQLLCEPEDRIGSQAAASTMRPDSYIQHQRQSGFFNMLVGRSIDGADAIKAHPWFHGIDWINIHRYPAPFQPELSAPDDTRHFEDDIPAEPLAPANGAPADATKDPLLLNQKYGAEILDVRKALAFAGFTHKSPRVISYVKADQAFPSRHEAEATETPNVSTLRRGRALSF